MADEQDVHDQDELGEDQQQQGVDQASNPDKEKSGEVESLRKEAGGYRKQLRSKEAELAAAQAKIKEFEDKDKSELDKATSSVTELTTKVETLEQTNLQLRIHNAFLMDKNHQWHNPKAALKLLDLSEVEIDDDGTVTGLDEAVKKLADDEPWLLKSNSDNDSDDSTPTPPAGQPTGRPKRKDEATRQKLLDKYPALKGR